MAIQNPYRPAQLVLIDTALWWYYEYIHRWVKVDTTGWSFETWQLMVRTAQRIEDIRPWRMPRWGAAAP